MYSILKSAHSPISSSPTSDFWPLKRRGVSRVFLIAGWPLSVLNDKVAAKYQSISIILRYLIRFGFYAAAGAVVGGIYGGLVFEGSLLMGTGLGLAASSIFYHVLLLIAYVKDKLFAS